MKHKLDVTYHLDKLELVFKTPLDYELPECIEVFHRRKVDSTPLSEIQIWNVNAIIPIYTVFICNFSRGLEGNFQMKNPPKNLYCTHGGKKHFIGEIQTYMKGAIKLKVANEFLYTNLLWYLREFEDAFNIELHRISKLDVCCDANQNLPRKLNDTLHSSKCSVCRAGRKRQDLYTEKGNFKLGKRISTNLKILTEREYLEPTFCFEIYPGTTQVTKLVGYNKTKEIEEVSSEKKYILECGPIEENETLYRLEVRLVSQYLTTQARKEGGWSLRFIFENLCSESFLKEIFIKNLNRFYNLKIEGKAKKISKLLRLD